MVKNKKLLYFEFKLYIFKSCLIPNIISKQKFDLLLLKNKAFQTNFLSENRALDFLFILISALI
ncbi:hypothetical protein HMPREF9446_00542 [Bacteroides fluxus YIT 12057]|uniref:Uncharacterized protein n=1 Tax=Bacteroides fluxus YIT 12057 TaxID=763034 RepID=F3PPA2_9BACE|nr:hypothetical protein HMPREF9446_00542 [Bacteroides fluxus YIT 12057]